MCNMSYMLEVSVDIFKERLTDGVRQTGFSPTIIVNHTPDRKMPGHFSRDGLLTHREEKRATSHPSGQVDTSAR